jgi:hypothetical protein
LPEQRPNLSDLIVELLLFSFQASQRCFQDGGV